MEEEIAQSPQAGTLFQHNLLLVDVSIVLTSSFGKSKVNMSCKGGNALDFDDAPSAPPLLYDSPMPGTSEGFTLECPITCMVMRDPVMLTGDGHTYERYAVEQWLRKGNKISPLTGAPLGENCLLVPNHAVRKAIADLNFAVPSKEEIEPFLGSENKEGELQGKESTSGAKESSSLRIESIEKPHKANEKQTKRLSVGKRVCLSVVIVVAVLVAALVVFLVVRENSHDEDLSVGDSWGESGIQMNGTSYDDRRKSWEESLDLSNLESVPVRMGGCEDIRPPTSTQHSCQQQVQWDKCKESWMRGYCRKSCGLC